MSNFYNEDFIVNDFHGVDLSHIDFKKEYKTQCPSCADRGEDNSGDNLHIFGLDDNGMPLGANCFHCDFAVPSLKNVLENEDDKQKSGFTIRSSSENNTLRSRVKRKSPEMDKKKLTKEQIDEVFSNTVDTLPIKYRGLQRYNSLMKKIGVRWKLIEVNNEYIVEKMYFPVYYYDGDKRELVGYRVRYAYRNGEQVKDFRVLGYCGVDTVEPLGKSVNSKVADTLIIVGGEIDLITTMGAMNDLKQRYRSHSINVISTISGEGSLSETIKNDYDWIVSHKKIVLAMDNDSAGQKAIDDALKVLPTEQCYLANFGEYKDPNDYGLETTQLQQDIYWNVQPVDDFGYVGADELFDEGLKVLMQDKIPLPDFLSDLKPYFTDGAIGLGEWVNIIAGTSTGKCFSGDQEILMHDLTTKKARDVVIGDKLMGRDGTPRSVVKLHSGFDDMYKITPVRGESYTVNSKHLLILNNNRARPSRGWLKDSEIKISAEELFNLPKTYLNHNLTTKFADLTEYGVGGNVDDAYILGLWLADGSKDGAVITLNAEDSNVFESRIKSWCDNKGFTYSYTSYEGKSGSVTCRIQGGFLDVLREWGVLGNKHIPSEFFTCSHEVRCSLIAGFIDGDGYNGGQGYEFTISNNQLFEDVIKIMRTVGLIVTVRDKIIRNGDNEDVVYKNVRSCGRCHNIPVMLDRKRIENYDGRKNINGSQLKIESVGVGEYFGFELDGDHIHCLPDMQITHNSTIIDAWKDAWIELSPYKQVVNSFEASSGRYGIKEVSAMVGKNISQITGKEARIEYYKSLRKEYMDRVIGKDGKPKFYFVSTIPKSIDQFKKMLLRLVKVEGVGVVWIDPALSLRTMCSDFKEFDALLTWIDQVIRLEHNTTIITVQHTRKNLSSGKNSSQGGELSEEDGEGSRMLISLATINIGIERNKESLDEVVRNTTIISLFKNRPDSKTGRGVAKLFYRYKANRLYPYSVASENGFFATDTSVSVEELSTLVDGGYSVNNVTDNMESHESQYVSEFVEDDVDLPW